MTPKFRDEAKEKLEKIKANGQSAPEALRYLEKLCGEANEEFNTADPETDGMTLVEEVFGGVFEGRQGYRWRANNAPEEEAERPAHTSAIGNRPVKNPFASEPIFEPAVEAPPEEQPTPPVEPEPEPPKAEPKAEPKKPAAKGGGHK